MEHFRYLRTSLTHQNSIQKGNKCRLKAQNACYRSAKNLLSSSLLSKNIKIKLYRATVFLLFCKGVKMHSRNCYTCNLTLKRKRKDNFNVIRENVFCETTNLFSRKKCPCWQKKKNKCYILPYYQRTDPCGEVTYFAKYSLTLTFVPTGSTLSNGHS